MGRNVSGRFGSPVAVVNFRDVSRTDYCIMYIVRSLKLKKSFLNFLI